MRAVERGGGREGGEKRADSHTDQKTTVPSWAQKTDTAVYSHLEWEGEKGGLTFTCWRSRKSSLASLLLLLFPSTQPAWSRRGLSACADEDQSAGRATVPTALLPAPPPCITLPHTITPKCSRGHTFRELSLACTHLLADKHTARQAGTPPPIICAGSSSVHIGVSGEGLYLAPQRQWQQQ